MLLEPQLCILPSRVSAPSALRSLVSLDREATESFRPVLSTTHGSAQCSYLKAKPPERRGPLCTPLLSVAPAKGCLTPLTLLGHR